MNSTKNYMQMLSSRGYVTTPIAEGLDYVEEIKRLKKEKKDVNREVSRQLTKEQKKREKKERWAAGTLQRVKRVYL